MRIVIFGAGHQGRIVADILLRAREAGSTAVPIGFVDDLRPAGEELILGLPLLGRASVLATIEHDGVIVAVGDNQRRREITEALAAAGERFPVARHPFVSIAPDATIGDGTMISAGTIITPGARIGRGVLLNTKSSVDHDTVIGDFSHVSAGATVGANVMLGDEVLIGLGATVASGRRVGARSIIGAGAVVVRDIPADVVAYGVPARVTSDRRSESSNR